MNTFEKRAAVRNRLLRMQSVAHAPRDGRGIYLGDGLPYAPNEEIRSQDLIDMIDQIDSHDIEKIALAFRTHRLRKAGVDILSRKYGFTEFLDYFRKKNHSNDLPYHNEYHSYQMVLNCFEGAQYQNISNDHEIKILLIAALFHDFNHSGGKLSDADNIKIAITGLYTANDCYELLNADSLNQCIKCIQYTQYPYIDTVPDTTLQCIIRDADLMSVYEETDSILLSQMQGLYSEICIQKPELTFNDFIEGNDKFLQNVIWQTGWGFEKAHQLYFDNKREYLKLLLIANKPS